MKADTIKNIAETLEQAGFSLTPRDITLRGNDTPERSFPVYASETVRAEMKKCALDTVLHDMGNWASSPVILVGKKDIEPQSPSPYQSLNAFLGSVLGEKTSIQETNIGLPTLKAFFDCAVKQKLLTIQTALPDHGRLNLIAMPNLEETTERYLERLTHVPKEEINLHVPSGLFYTMGFAHEAGHCALRHIDETRSLYEQLRQDGIPALKLIDDLAELRQEAEADLWAFRILDRLEQTGKMSANDVLSAKSLQKTIRKHINTRLNNIHATAPFLEEPDRSAKDTYTAFEALKKRALLHMFEGTLPPPDVHYVIWADEVYDSLKAVFNQGVFPEGSQEQRFVTDYLEACHTIAPDFFQSGRYRDYWGQQRQEFESRMRP